MSQDKQRDDIAVRAEIPRGVEPGTEVRDVGGFREIDSGEVSHRRPRRLQRDISKMPLSAVSARHIPAAPSFFHRAAVGSVEWKRSFDAAVLIGNDGEER